MRAVAALCSLVLLAIAAPMHARPQAEEPQGAQDTNREIVQAPEGGRLDAVDADGAVIGACPLRHTDVEVSIAGHFTRVTLRQEYQNPYDDKIEAVYTFPMSHRAAVDRMRMMVGSRIIEGEVKERDEARRIYEAARDRGHVASLLEQERPNIFTQSVANIEPGASVTIELSYIETLEAKDGEYTFDFPMVVGPRYIPGSPNVSPADAPAELELRQGAVLLGPAQLEVQEQGTIDELGTLQAGKLQALLSAAQAIRKPTESFWGTNEEDGSIQWPQLWHSFGVTYPDGSKEPGRLFVDGTGVISDRWFYTDPDVIKGMGPGFAADTNQVPDASRITPMPTKPGTRAGHDISIRVAIDTGGPAIRNLESELHEITVEEDAADIGSAVELTLAEKSEIPNRDFVLRWSLENEALNEAILAHTTGDAEKGNFLTLILNPPARVEPETIRPRELIFVMDTSGSMRGFPIEKSKEVMRKAIASMRPNDRFNLITFAGHTQILWDEAKSASEANRDAALALIDSQQGSGGTEMMKAIDAALVQTANAGANRDGDDDQPMRIVIFLTDGYVGNDMAIIDAVQKNANTTRVFSLGVGNSINRYLLDAMARAGRGEVEYVLLASEADEVVERLARRIETPVLTDITLEFSDNLSVHDVLPGTKVTEIPDLFDVKPIVIHARYEDGGEGTVTVRGRTAAGDFERTIDLDLPQSQAQNDQIATLWARAQIGNLMNRDLDGAQGGEIDAELKSQIIALGVNYSIVSNYTSFVAVEKSRVTISGKPMLVPVPIEMPDGVSYEGVFGGEGQQAIDEEGQLVMHLVPRSGAVRLADKAHDLERLGQYRRVETWADGNAIQGQGIVQAGRPAASPSMNVLARRARVATPGGGGGGGGAGFGGGGSGLAGQQATGAFQPMLETANSDTVDLSVEDISAYRLEEGEQTPTGTLAAFFGNVEQPLFTERLALTIALLVEADAFDTARTLAEHLAEVHSDHEIAKRLVAALDEEAVEADADAAREEVAVIAAEARATIEQEVAGRLREARIRNVVADDLEPFAMGQGFPETLDGAGYDGPVPPDSVWQDGGVLTVVLFDDLDDADIAAVENLGAKVIERIDDANFIIVVSPLGRFDDLALLEGVGRVELAKPQPAR